jgi:apolipoprotein N-acyltransferase
MALAFPWNDHEWLGWIALVPFFVALCNRKPVSGYLLSFLWVVVLYPTLGPWLFNIRGYSLLQHAIFDFYLGFIWGPFGLSFCIVARRWGTASALVAAPFLWVTFEFLRSNLGFMAFPWGMIAHSQYLNIPIIQIASVFGTYSISFLLVLINSAIAALVLYLVGGNGKLIQLVAPSVSKRWMVSISIPAVFFIITAYIFGGYVVSSPTAGQKISVSVVQGNIEQKNKWDSKYARTIMQAYTTLTEEAAGHRPDLIVWPEAATPWSITQAPQLYQEIRRLARNANASLLLGSSSHVKFKKGAPKKSTYQNSAFLIGPRKEDRRQQYDKMVLLPFGEYLPMKDKIPWSAINIPDPGSFLPGKDYALFNGPTGRIGVAICWESIFAEHVRQLVRRGAQLVINISNEAWFGKTAAPYQMLSMNVFRAVENNVFVVRCSNTGVSCFIDPNGRILKRVQDSNGEDLFVRGTATETVTLLNSSTFYTRHGDVLPYVCIVFSVFLVTGSFFKRAHKVYDRPVSVA